MRLNLSLLSFVFAIVLACGAAEATKTPSCNVIPKQPVPVMNYVELRAWYKVYNRNYFFDHLPEARFEWENMHAIHRMGQTDCSFKPCLITLDITYNEAFPVAKATILHEMCHVETWGEQEDHGKKWQACMHTLWLEGAFDGLI